MNYRHLLLACCGLTLCLPQGYAASAVIAKEDFETPNAFGKFTPVSVSSAAGWIWNVRTDNGGYLQMNGFGSDEPSDDWLILTQPLDLGDVANPTARFEFIAQFAGPNVEFLVSTNYDPSMHANPGDATWASLPYFTVGGANEPSEGGSFTELLSDPVDLSAYRSDQVYLAFHYVSLGTGGGDGRLWRVLDFTVEDSDPSAILLFTPFEDIDPWSAVNVKGSDEWSIFFQADRTSAVLDGAFAVEENEDWLISPSLNVAQSDIPVVNFDYYTESSGPTVQLLVSADYEAAVHTDPNMATWAELPLDILGAPAETWTSVVGQSFNGISGEKVRVAFRYTTTAGEAPQGRSVGISNVCVYKAAEAPALVAKFAGIPRQPTTADTVQFDALASGGKRPFAYVWDFGDGTASNVADPSHRYMNPGSYAVKLTVTDALGGESTVTLPDYINVANPANVLLNTNFEGANDEGIPAPWATYSVASDAEWLLDTEASRSGAVISGFGTDEASEDWLLSPKFTLDAGQLPVMTADVFTNFNGPLLEVLVSSDYDGGDPTGATWMNLNVDLSTLVSQQWTEVSGLSLAGLSGEYTLAFKYVTTGVGSGDARTYGVDNVRVINESELPVLSDLSLSASVAEVTTADVVKLKPFVTGGKHPYVYAWDFGDGSSSAEALPEHTYAEAGSYSVSLTVTDAAGSARVASLIGTIEVIDIDSVLYTKDFEGFNGDDPEDGWLTVSLASLADWNLFTQSGQQGVFINGFRSDEASDDWLISPVIPIVPGERATLSFDLNRFFSGGSFGVFASVDYDPVSGDPNAATWLPIATSFTTDDWSRPSDLVIPLSGNVRIGFHYTSDGVEAGDSQRIGVDRIQVVRVATSDAFVDTDFEGAVGDPVPGPWTAVNVASDAVWDFREWNGRVGAFMNGFGADGASEDWLISPAMDFSGDEIPILSFSHFVRFGGPNLQVLVSSDYVSDPNAASWTDLQIDFGNLPEREWIDFKDISLDAFDGSATHLAFKYVSNGGEAGDGRLAGIDSVVIAKSDVAPMLAVEATFPLSAGAGEPVTVVAVASGGSLPYTYAWDFGDGTTALGAEASHAYLDSGRFTATLVVTDGAGAKTVASAEIAILAFGEVVLEGMFTGDDDASIAEPWMAVSVASDRGWQIDTTGGAQGAVVNGFGADEASEDWLISPPFDLAFGAQTTLGFDYYQNFSGPELELLIGADFAPDTDPNTVHWSPIVHDLSTVPNSAWSRQSGIDLSGFVGRQCRLAFRYVTTGTAGGDGKLIGINGVRVRTIIPPMPAPETYTYEEWIGVNGYFKTGDPAGLASADADGDGFANGFEHRFDLSPKSGAGYENLPQISRLDDGTFRLTYRRIADETAWKVQLSADLESWKDAVEGQDIDTSIEKNEVIETVTLDLKAPETFFRVVLP